MLGSLRGPLKTLLVAGCLVALASTGCTRMTRLPTMASNSGGSNSNSDSGGSDSGGSGDSSNSGGSSNSDSGGSGNSGSGSGGGGDGAVSATVSLAIVVGILGVVYLASLSRGPQAGPAGLDSAQRERAIDEARRWLAQHRRQVRADIARGAGPFVDELAAVHTLPVALRPRLGAALQRAHAELDAPLADGPPSADETVAFADALGRALGDEPSLATHLARVDAPH